MENAVVAKLGRSAKIGLTAALALGGVGFLVSSSADQPTPYKMVDELFGDGLEAWYGKPLKVHGWVTAGSIVREVVTKEMHQTFVLQKSGKQIRVFSHGALPDTFKDRVEVVVTGRLVAAESLQPVLDLICAGREHGCPLQADGEQSWVLEASAIAAKCTGKYDYDPNRVDGATVFR